MRKHEEVGGDRLASIACSWHLVSPERIDVRVALGSLRSNKQTWPTETGAHIEGKITSNRHVSSNSSVPWKRRSMTLL